MFVNQYISNYMHLTLNELIPAKNLAVAPPLSFEDDADWPSHIPTSWKANYVLPNFRMDLRELRL